MKGKRKGDVNRFIMLLVILLIVSILIVGLYYAGIYRLVQDVFAKRPK